MSPVPRHVVQSRINFSPDNTALRSEQLNTTLFSTTSRSDVGTRECCRSFLMTSPRPQLAIAMDKREVWPGCLAVWGERAEIVGKGGGASTLARRRGSMGAIAGGLGLG
ncbi:hypothetical protein SKAU_G00304800 [Synaphobranchus kaupii]|uniref:Uncharacterized protein n=1 Tax=Synaphobranchus kaupii TaxID=118154 RepID=A0A9Q1IMN4_SYNKA|nr:hypothetical protein SKAU_G00304800 [Synaphobranchus kaupii]